MVYPLINPLVYAPTVLGIIYQVLDFCALVRVGADLMPPIGPDVRPINAFWRCPFLNHGFMMAQSVRHVKNKVRPQRTPLDQAKRDSAAVIASSRVDLMVVDKLAEPLRLIRVFHDVSQTSLATKLGVSKSFLCEIESGKKRPSLELLTQYANEFEVPVSSLMFFAESVAANGDTRPTNRVAPKVLALLRWIAASREVPHLERKPAQRQTSFKRSSAKFGS